MRPDPEGPGYQFLFWVGGYRLYGRHRASLTRDTPPFRDKSCERVGHPVRANTEILHLTTSSTGFNWLGIFSPPMSR
jgi:hypothetical protein